MELPRQSMVGWRPLVGAAPDAQVFSRARRGKLKIQSSERCFFSLYEEGQPGSLEDEFVNYFHDLEASYLFGFKDSVPR